MKQKIYLSVVMLFVAVTSFAQTKMVTFQVQSPDSTPVYVFGSWSNWSNFPGTLMTSLGSGKYTTTMALTSNTSYEFLFVNGGTPVKEVLNPAWTCTNGNATYTNRVLALGSNDTGVCYTFHTCNTCTVTPPPPPPANINVTFQVQSPDSLPVSLIGSWNWSSYPGATMSLISANKYSVTIQLPANSTQEFLFVNGATPVKEVLNPTWTCTNGNTTYTNRTLSLGNVDTSICFTWATCTKCTPTPPPSSTNITFQVQNPDSTPVYVFGNWNNWANFPGTLMTSIGSGKYSVTMPLNSNSSYEYLYVNGSAKEVLNPAWSCTNGNGQYTNRTLVVGTSPFTKCNKWALCDSCGAITPSNINVKFAVQGTDSTPVYVFGSWNSWGNFPGTPMTYNATKGVYEVVIPMAANDTIEYLYVNGVGTKEVLNPAWSCTNGNATYTNRMVTLGTKDTSFCNRWQSCSTCFPLAIGNSVTDMVNISVSNDIVRINSSSFTKVDQLEIFDIVGKRIFTSNGNVNTNENIPVSLQNNTFYILRVKNGNAYYKVKAIIKNN